MDIQTPGLKFLFLLLLATNRSLVNSLKFNSYVIKNFSFHIWLDSFSTFNNVVCGVKKKKRGGVINFYQHHRIKSNVSTESLSVYVCICEHDNSKHNVLER